MNRFYEPFCRLTLRALSKTHQTDGLHLGWSAPCALRQVPDGLGEGVDHD